MHQGQHPNRVPLNLIHQPITFVRHQFASACDLARLAHLWMRGQPSGRIAEKLIHAHGRVGVVGRDVVPNVGAVLFRLWRPDDYY